MLQIIFFIQQKKIRIYLQRILLPVYFSSYLFLKKFYFIIIIVHGQEYGKNFNFFCIKIRVRN